jgi:hypothetical protein
MTVELVEGPARYRGRLPPKHFAPSRKIVGARSVGATATGAQGVFGCWGMFADLGGNWLQGQVSRCFGASTAKAVSCYQYGQSGTPVRMSMDWCYTGALEEQRRLELGGNPTLAELEANPLTDTGSEPAAGWNRFKLVGFAPESVWPSTVGFNPKEMTIPAEFTAAMYQPVTLGQASIIAPPGAAMLAACYAALQPFSDGKFGQTIQVSVASATSAFENADGTRVLFATDFNGANYDHSVDLIGVAPAAMLRALGLAMPNSTTGNLYLLSNHWEDWGDSTFVPELDSTGSLTGKTVAFPGAVWVSEDAVNAMADQSQISEAA